MASRFIEPFRRFFAVATDAPFEFGEASALMALSSVAIGRRWINRGSGINPNLYMMLTGDSSVARKSTCVMFAKKLLLDVDPDRVGPDDYTVEGLIKWIGDRNKSESGDEKRATKKTGSVIALFADEFGSDLAKMDSYGSTLQADFTKLYDGQSFEKVRVTRGTIYVHNPRISLFAAAAYSMLSRYLKPQDWETGYLMRWLYVSPQQMRPVTSTQPVWPELPYRAAASALGAVIADMNAAGAIAINLSADADAYLGQVGAHFRSKALGQVPQIYVERFVTNLIKVALLYRLDDYLEAEAPITAEHVHKAAAFADSACWGSFLGTYEKTSTGDYRGLLLAIFEQLVTAQREGAEAIDWYDLTGRHLGNPLLSKVMIDLLRGGWIAKDQKPGGGFSARLVRSPF